MNNVVFAELIAHSQAKKGKKLTKHNVRVDMLNVRKLHLAYLDKRAIVVRKVLI